MLSSTGGTLQRTTMRRARSLRTERMIGLPSCGGGAQMCTMLGRFFSTQILSRICARLAAVRSRSPSTRGGTSIPNEAR